MNSRTPTLFAIGALVAVFLLSLAVLARPVRADLPPRPTPSPEAPTPDPAPSYDPPPGSWIQLHTEFPVDWPWREVHWQTLWTVMQWQDPQGAWHEVEGWQGTLDDVSLAPDGGVTGEKAWWLGEANQGTGPFRWQVTLGREGNLLAISAPFDLPEVDGQAKTVTVSLTMPQR
jgi:hypothetical protein